jgi:predicted Ser/Thr protein kinase
MNPQKTCQSCGTPLADDSPRGLCAACLMKVAMATATGAGDAPSGFTPPETAELAAKFPQLEILELIGKGGMGAVYKARQKELDRFVALKILPPSIGSDPAFAERFAREAKALARLNHPGIVTIYDFGRADGLFYFLMEFVDGVNLRQLLQSGRVSPREALAIVPQICDALQFAHDQGIVHRDIKPENILLDRRGRVKVADFGLAKLVGASSESVSGGATGSGSPAQTESGKIMGTPNYMAPEQKENFGDVDHRADIYALGVVFYQMLTGELPGKHIEPPSKKVQIDVRLDEVVLRALEKKPELRFQQASMLKTQMETIAQTPPAGSWTETILARDYSLNIGQCLNRGWNLVAANFWPAVGVSALLWLLSSIARFSVLGILIHFPLVGGLWLYYLNRIRGQTATLETAFSGFKVAFLQLMLLGLVVQILTLLGLICLIIPGIYLWVIWTFAVALVADKNLEFWTAMELSRKVVSKHWWKFLWFHIILLLIYIAGYLCCYVGIFIAMPFCSAALAWAYEDIFGGTPPVIGDAPVAAPLTPSASGGNGGKAIAIAAVVIAAAILILFFGLLIAIAIPNFVRAREHTHKLKHHIATQAKASQARLETSAAMAVSRARNFAANGHSLPKLQFLAWQDQWQTNQTASAWHPDGTLVTNATELKWLKAAQPSSFRVAGLNPQPHFLHLWFSSPDFRQGIFSQILLLNDGKPIKPGANADVGGSSQSPNEFNGNLGWVYWTLVPVEGTNRLDHLTVRLRYADGPLEHIQYIPNSAQYDSTLENESLLGGFGQDTDSNAFVSITENGKAMKSREFDVQAVTRDGQQLDSTGNSENYLGDGDGPRVEKFMFPIPVANVEKFVVGTRPIHTVEWKDVKLPAENVSATNETQIAQ